MIHSIVQVLLPSNNNNNNTSTTNSANARRVKKNNVIVSDEDVAAAAAAITSSTNNNNQTRPVEFELNGHDAAVSDEFDFTTLVNEDKTPTVASSVNSNKEFSILTNPIKYKPSSRAIDESPSIGSLNAADVDSNHQNSDGTASPESSTSEKAAVAAVELFDTCNLIPINSSSFNVNNSNLAADTLSSKKFKLLTNFNS